jgi:aldehyde dehydrogenase (NAD+)
MESQNFKHAFEELKKGQSALKSESARQRIARLKKLKRALLDHQVDLKNALKSDFSKGSTETEVSEIMTSLLEINYAIRNLRQWSEPQRVETPGLLFGTKTEVRYEPKGVVLIIGPWNYPFSLCINPLVAAIAAGNSAIVKPSELTPNTSKLLKKILESVFSREEVRVIEGGEETVRSLLDLDFDHFFFTGSTRVGRIVALAAADKLASCTLELGGKSPAVVLESADIKNVATSIVGGKFLNAGQTCVAPDFLVVHKSLKEALLIELVAQIKIRFGENANDRIANEEYCRIINTKHYSRLQSLVENSLLSGAKVIFGFELQGDQNYISPTVLEVKDWESEIMKEEIFGPILPVLEFENLGEVIDKLNQRAPPLAFYIFGSHPAQIQTLISKVRSGGVTVNNTIIHMINPEVPFGGVRQSGIGNYHGKYGFLAFSNLRTVTDQSHFNLSRLAYPKFTRFKKAFIEFMVRNLT